MTTWIIGNWKQNPATQQEAQQLVEQILEQIPQDLPNSHKLMVAPSNIHLMAVAKALQDSPILVSAQNISAHSDTTGAYTGDCSAQQVKDAGASWTLLGHSEQRQYHHENNDHLAQKICNAFLQDLGVIFCVGETLADYEQDQTLSVLDHQLSAFHQAFEQIASEEKNQFLQYIQDRMIIAYEPVWAIGTGKIPTIDEIDRVHQHIKTHLQTWITKISGQTPKLTVLYGGSVNPQNAPMLAQCPTIDGALIGGASLKPKDFLQIANQFFASKS